MYIPSKQIIHVVDEATHYNAALFRTKIISEKVWRALLKCWSQIYLGCYDQGSQFVSKEFTENAEADGTIPVYQIDRETVVIQLPSGRKIFRSNVVKHVVGSNLYNIGEIKLENLRVCESGKNDCDVLYLTIQWHLCLMTVKTKVQSAKLM